MCFFSSVWFQDPMSYLYSNVFLFFNLVMLIVTVICLMVLYWMIGVLKSELSYRSFIEHESLEIWWTIVPFLVLLFIGIPSMRILYEWESQSVCSMNLKVLGYQWYWGYEYKELSLMFESFMLNLKDLNEFSYRIMDVDSRLVLPGETPIRLLVSSKDVLHSWALPNLGVKMDAVPGRLNSVRLIFFMSGVYYGQCSELCGVGHSLMPVVVEVVSFNEFMVWVKKMLSVM